MDAVGAFFSGSLTGFPSADTGRKTHPFSCSQEHEPKNGRVGQLSQRRMLVFDPLLSILGSSCIPHSLCRSSSIPRCNTSHRFSPSERDHQPQPSWHKLLGVVCKMTLSRKHGICLADFLLLCPSGQRTFLHAHAVAGKGSLLKCIDGQPFPWWWPSPILCPYPNAQQMMKVTVKFNSRPNLKTASPLCGLR